MELYIVRHGIAIDREDPKSPPDPDRYLTEEGIEKTKQVAKGVAALGIEPDLLISSPYVRAMQTAEIFATAFEYPKQKIRTTDSAQARRRTRPLLQRTSQGQRLRNRLLLRPRSPPG